MIKIKPQIKKIILANLITALGGTFLVRCA